ncbi:MAG: SRPBCC domain-containing protein [Bdellovibrionota bacterium]
MSSNDLNFEVDQSIRIMKPATVIFDAITKPEHLIRYFTARAEGKLEAGKTVHWAWSGKPDQIPVEVVECVAPTRLVFKWPTHDKMYLTTVQFDLEDQQEKGTLVRVREGKFKSDQAGFKNTHANTGGWMQMLCNLKAYLELNVDLRSNPLPQNWK